MGVKVSVRRRSRAVAGDSVRWGLAVVAGAVAIAASYAVQRLWSKYVGEAPFGSVVLAGSVPYYWRLATALLHGVVVASLVALGVGEDEAATALRWAPVWAMAIGLPLAFAMVAVP